MRSSLSFTLSTALILALSGLSTGCLHDPVAERQEQRTESFNLLTRGQQLKEQGDYLLARDVFLEAVEVSPRPVLYYEIGDCYYHLERYEESADYLRRSLEMQPGYKLAKAELELVEAKLDSLPPAPANQATGQEIAEREETPSPMPEKAADPEVGSPAPATDQTKEIPADRKSDQTAIQPAKLPEAMTWQEEQALDSEPEDRAPQGEQAEEEPEAEPTPRETAESGQQADLPEAGQQESTAPAGPFGGIARAFENLGSAGGTGGEAAKDLDPVQVRRVVFPELDQSDPLSTEMLKQGARESAELGRFDEAVRRWERVLNREPNNLEARLGLAEALYRSGRTRRAQEEYQKAASRNPDSAEAHFQLGNFYVQVKDYRDAAASFNEALELDPGFVRARNNLGALHLDLGNAELAMENLEQVIEAAPSFAPAWLNLALARDDAGRPAAEVLDSLETYQRLTTATDPETEKWLRELRLRVQSENP